MHTQMHARGQREGGDRDVGRGKRGNDFVFGKHGREEGQKESISIEKN